MSSRLVCVLFALCLTAAGGQAWAQKSPPASAPAAGEDAHPPSAEDVAAARAYAERLIERAGADGLFVNISSGITPRVQHVRSHMMCEFDVGEADRITLFEPGPAAPGDDVSCNTYIPAHHALVTLYATRYRAGNLDSHFSGAVEEMRERYRDMTAWTGEESQIALPDGAPAARHARYVVTEQGQQQYTRMSMIEIDGWTVMLRFSSDVDDADTLDDAASRIFALAASYVMGQPIR